MLLFTISASAEGRNILRGEKLTFDDVLLALGIIESYSRVIPVSMNITSRSYSGLDNSPNDYIDAILFNEFVNGGRRPHLIYLDEHKISLPNGKTVYEDRSHSSGYNNYNKRYEA